MEPVRIDYSSRVDGLQDYYFLHNAGENTACVVSLHGHGSHGDQPFTRKDVAELLLPIIRKYDLSLITPNLRDNAWMSCAAVEDLRDILVDCKEKYRFSRYIFLAGSMGGTGALIFATQHPELVSALGVMGGATSLQSYREYCSRHENKIIQEIAQAIADHYTPEDYEKHNVIRHFDKLQMPLCYYHGEADYVMPVTEMLNLQEKMKTFPHARFKVIPEGNHDSPLHCMKEIFESVSGLQDFESVYQREAATIQPGAPYACLTGYNLVRYFTGKYFAEHPADDTPECIVHANAFAYALEQLPLHFPADQRFTGGVETFQVQELPDGITPEQYQEYSDIVSQRGSRFFQVGWDHTAPDYNTLMERGLGDFIRRAQKAKEELQRPESEAMLIALQAVSNYFRRAGESWRESRPVEAERLRHLATEPPRTFADGLQLMWLLFVLLTSQTRHHMALARIDQYLYPLYQRDTIDRTEALNQLCHIFSKLEGFHAVSNICIGGVKPDGSDAVNELSYLVLKAVERVHSPSTNLSARLHKDSPEPFIRACAKLIATGIGFPAIMNDEVYIPSMMRCSIPLEAARDYALFGCVEGNIPGRAPAWSDSRFSLVESFLETIADLETFETCDELWDRFAASVRTGMERHLEKYNQMLLEYPAERCPDPLLSALTRDCIARGLDINNGGAEFPRQHGVGICGPATIADSLAAIKKLVFEEKRIPKDQLLAALRNNFEGYEVLRQTLINCAPKYGNDDPYVDEFFTKIVALCSESAMNKMTVDHGYLRICMASNISNVSVGKRTRATPDGRLAETPLSDAASPNAGMDRSGSTAFINSVVKSDYTNANCTVVNMRFLPDMFQDEAGYDRLTVLLKRFIAGGGHEIQFNVTRDDVLKDAMEHPENYGDLIVRVSGFSAIFTKLDPAVQRDILRRNSHGK